MNKTTAMPMTIAVNTKACGTGSTATDKKLLMSAALGLSVVKMGGATGKMYLKPIIVAKMLPASPNIVKAMIFLMRCRLYSIPYKAMDKVVIEDRMMYVAKKVSMSGIFLILQDFLENVFRK